MFRQFTTPPQAAPLVFALALFGCEAPSSDSGAPFGFGLSKADIYATQGSEPVDPVFGSTTTAQATCQSADDVLLSGSCHTNTEAPLVLTGAGAQNVTAATDGVSYWQCAYLNQGWDGSGSLNVLATAYCVRAY